MKKLFLISLFIYSKSLLALDHIVAPELHRDPFINPMQAKPLTDENHTSKGSSNTKATRVEKSRQSFLWQPEIRGIIRSEDIAVVNIGGEMIELGNDYKGYRLIKVKEQSVVFEKNGKKYPITMEPSGAASESEDEK